MPVFLALSGSFDLIVARRRPRRRARSRRDWWTENR